MTRYIITLDEFMKKSDLCDCPSCREKIETALAAMPTIPDWATHFTTERPDENGEPFWSRQEIPK